MNTSSFSTEATPPSNPWLPLTEESLCLLPPQVLATVRDYATGDEEQLWRLHDYTFDVDALDSIPVPEDSTLEILPLSGWVWRACTGRISLSPLWQAEDQRKTLPDQGTTNIMAWIVEREQKTGLQHITVWKICVPDEQAYRLIQTHQPHILQLLDVASVRVEAALYPPRKGLETMDGATFLNLRDLQAMIAGILADLGIPEEAKAVWRGYYATLSEVIFYWEQGATTFPQYQSAYQAALEQQDQCLPLSTVPAWITQAGVPFAEAFTQDRISRCWWLAGWQVAAQAALVRPS